MTLTELRQAVDAVLASFPRATIKQDTVCRMLDGERVPIILVEIDGKEVEVCGNGDIRQR